MDPKTIGGFVFDCCPLHRVQSALLVVVDAMTARHSTRLLSSLDTLVRSPRLLQARTFATPPKKSLPQSEGPNSPLGMMDRVPKKSDPKLDSQSSACSPPYPPFPDGVNPNTGEVNGPSGPEPTRFGDWERKGRVSDF